MPAINLQKHGAEMQKALKSVRDQKNSTDWALFGYDGKTFDLKVVETGEDGIEEMVNDLNASKILYGFMRVKDPKSGLPKYVFLHWQGEGCPVTLKGQASNLLKNIGCSCTHCTYTKATPYIAYFLSNNCSKLPTFC